MVVSGINKKVCCVLSTRTLLVILAGFMLFSTGCSRTIVREEFYQSYQVRPGTVLEIYNPNGPVSVTASDHDEMEITALKETYRGQSALDQVDIFIDIGATMIIETIHPDDATNVSVSFDIKVPEDVYLSVIECANGSIDVSGISGDPILTTSNGNISVSEVAGIVSARSSNGDLLLSGIGSLASLITSNGNITAELLDLGDDLEIRTSNGSIDLSINPELAFDLQASTSNGEIDFNNLGLETTLQEQTNLIGFMNEGGPRLDITTSNGSIILAGLQ